MLRLVGEERSVMWRIPFYLFWSFCSLLLVLRITFDITTYRNGACVLHEIVLPGEFQYLLYMPRGYNEFERRSPLVVFLHGAGETDKGLDVLSRCNICHYVSDAIPPDEFPFIVVCPQTRQYGWQPKDVIQFIDKFVNDASKRYRIDTDRIYLTGVSMGGFGTFETASVYPDRFAAIVPLCGGGEPELAQTLTNMPVWAFHGDADNVVPYECTSKVINAINAQGNDSARLTTLSKAGHDIAGDVYARRELYRWLLEQKKHGN